MIFEKSGERRIRAAFRGPASSDQGKQETLFEDPRARAKATEGEPAAKRTTYSQAEQANSGVQHCAQSVQA